MCSSDLTPLVSGAAVRFEGQIAVYRTDLPDSPCYACLFDGDTADDGAGFSMWSPTPCDVLATDWVEVHD